MNAQTYEKIKQTINSNPGLPRDQIYKILVKLLKSEKNYENANKDPLKENQNPHLKINFELGASDEKETDPINYQAFISIYSNLKRRQMFKTSMWRKLKENAVCFSNKYKESRTREVTNETDQFKDIEARLESNTILNMAKEINLSPVLMTRLIVEGLLKTNSIELVDQTESSVKSKEKITISSIIRDNHLLKDGRLACEIMECCSLGRTLIT